MNILSFAVGIIASIVYFGGLRWNVRLFTEGGSVRTMILVMIGRFALLGSVLTVASLEGATPLLAMALGVFVARFAIMRRVRMA